MNCPRCHAPNNEGDKFCEQCGAPLPPPAEAHDDALGATVLASPETEAVLVRLGGEGSAPHTLGNRVTVGRLDSCDIPVDDKSVSREHARLSRLRDGYVIEDLGSTNGTLINGKRISEAVLLRPGDVVTIGSVDFRYDIENGQSPPPHAAFDPGATSAMTSMPRGFGGFPGSQVPPANFMEGDEDLPTMRDLPSVPMTFPPLEPFGAEASPEPDSVEHAEPKARTDVLSFESPAIDFPPALPPDASQDNAAATGTRPPGERIPGGRPPWEQFGEESSPGGSGGRFGGPPPWIEPPADIQPADDVQAGQPVAPSFEPEFAERVVPGPGAGLPPVRGDVEASPRSAFPSSVEGNDAVALADRLGEVMRNLVNELEEREEANRQVRAEMQQKVQQWERQLDALQRRLDELEEINKSQETVKNLLRETPPRSMSRSQLGSVQDSLDALMQNPRDVTVLMQLGQQAREFSAIVNEYMQLRGVFDRMAKSLGLSPPA